MYEGESDPNGMRSITASMWQVQYDIGVYYHENDTRAYAERRTYNFQSDSTGNPCWQLASKVSGQCDSYCGKCTAAHRSMMSFTIIGLLASVFAASLAGAHCCFYTN